MRLGDYFQQQKQATVSETQKFAIYEKIINQRTSWIHKRSLFHIKSFVYGLTLTGLVLTLYGTFFIKNNIRNNDNGVSIQTPKTYQVQADYIANIVNFNGDFFIEHQGNRIQTSNIHNWDTIILDSNTKMTFNMDQSTQARINWPAKFILQKDNSHYTIKLIHGDFVNIESLQNKHTQALDIIAKEFSIHQDRTSKTVNFQLVNKGKQHIITNKWTAKVTVNKDNKKTDINQEELLTIENNDINLLTVQEFNQALKTKKLSQTFTLQKDDTQKTTQDITNQEDNKELLSILNNTGDKQINTEQIQNLTKDLGITNTQDKQLLSLEDNNKLLALLNAHFITQDLQELFIQGQAQHNKEFTIAYNNLESRIQQLYQILAISYPTSRGDFNILQNNINNIQNKIQTNYLIPPKYLHNLSEINHGIQLIIWAEYSERNQIYSQLNFE